MNRKNVVIKQKNKKSGITYLYWGHSTYVPGKPYPVVSKIGIGRINAAGAFEPNKNFLALPPEEQLETGLVDDPCYALFTRGDTDAHEYKMYGFVALLETTAKKTGVWDALKRVFPNDWKQLLTCVEAMMSYPDRDLYRPKHFHDVCLHTLVDPPAEDGIAKALDAVDSASIERFFGYYQERLYARQGASTAGEIVVYPLDTRRISTYSALLEAAKYGRNNEGSDHAQIDLLMICDKLTGIPLYYQPLLENCSVRNVLNGPYVKEFKAGTTLILDREFHSLDTIQLLKDGDLRFLAGLPPAAKMFKDAVQEAHGVIFDTENYHAAIRMYCYTRMVTNETPSVRGTGSRDLSVYLFLHPDRQAEEQQQLAERFARGKADLEEHGSLYSGTGFYGTYYTVEQDSEGNIISVSHNNEAQRRRMTACGFSGYLGPAGLSPEQVLKLTRGRDRIEKAYEGYRARMHRPNHSLDEHLEGKVFLAFLTTILELHIRRIMHEYLLYDQYTFQDLRDEVFDAKLKKPAGKVPAEGSWDDLPLEVQKLFYIFEVVKPSQLRDDVPKLVRDELKGRRQGHGLSVG